MSPLCRFCGDSNCDIPFHGQHVRPDLYTKTQIMSLTFDELRTANILRLAVFPGHAQNPWNAADWMVAVVGEVGELANKMKRLRRGVVVRGKQLPTKADLAEEFADIVIYLDLLAAWHDIELSSAVREKFNLVSSEINCNVTLS